MEDLYLTFNKNLYKITEQQIVSYNIDPERITSGTLSATFNQLSGVIQAGKQQFTNLESGYILGIDRGIAKLFIGDSTNYLNWDGTDFIISGSNVILNTGNQTIGGIKTFTSDPIIPDEAYGNSWNGVLEPPTKNAVYDKIETLVFSPQTFINTTFETSGRFATLVSGGTNTFNTTGLLIDTGSGLTQCAGVIWQIGPNGSGGDIVAGNPVFSASFNTTLNGATGSSFIGIGVPTVAGTGHTYTIRHAGFKILYTVGPTATLYATQADGTTETVSSALTTFSSNDNVEVCFRINGSSSIDYYWRKNSGAWSSATNLTTNMPNSSTGQFAQFSISNNSTTEQNKLTFLGASYRR